MIKKLRRKMYGISYRLRMKTIHKLGLCQPEVYAVLAERHELLKTHWVVPYRCDWCGASNRRVVSPSEYQVLQSRSWKRQQKISRLFGD